MSSSDMRQCLAPIEPPTELPSLFMIPLIAFIFHISSIASGSYSSDYLFSSATNCGFASYSSIANRYSSLCAAWDSERLIPKRSQLLELAYSIPSTDDALFSAAGPCSVFSIRLYCWVLGCAGSLLWLMIRSESRCKSRTSDSYFYFLTAFSSFCWASSYAKKFLISLFCRIQKRVAQPTPITRLSPRNRIAWWSEVP